MGQNLDSYHQDVKNVLFGGGMPIAAPADIHWVLKAGTATEDYWSQRISSGFTYDTVLDAYGNMTTEQNDVMLITPESHSLASALTWSLNTSHMVGSYPGGRYNVRNRIGMGAAFSPMVTVSGYGNTFHDIYTMHGTAAADYIGWTVSGNRNSFFNCHFGGPMIAAQGGHASYNGFNITGEENYFKGCTFGTSTIGRDEVTPNVTVNDTARVVFDDCLFLLFADDADPTFMNVVNDAGTTEIFLNNCKFLALSSNMATAITVAFTTSAGSTCTIILDPNCSFTGVTNLISASDDVHLYIPRTFSTTTDTEACVTVLMTT